MQNIVVFFSFFHFKTTIYAFFIYLHIVPFPFI